MADGTILISTHRLKLAGAIRSAVEERGYRVDLVPEAEQLDLAPDPVLLILTGGGGGELEPWVRGARELLEVPFITVLNGRVKDDQSPGRRSPPAGSAREVSSGSVREDSEGSARKVSQREASSRPLSPREEGLALGAEDAFSAQADPEEVAGAAHRAVERERLRKATGVVGRSEAMREILERVVQFAPVPSTVLITGESGTGKELVARGIHHLSPRRNQAFLAVNVAALSDSLLESELFGHEKGAFTGAIDSRRGFFELAHKGSLFLDEIGEMPLSTQTKLLRILERGEFLRVGGETPREADVRIVAATNRDLRAQVASGEFRRDLYYRLNVLNIELPPLRARRDDIPLLIDHFVRDLSRRIDRPFPGITPRAMAVLQAYDWPGNVRELRNLVESMVVLAPGREIEPEDIPREIRFPREGIRLLPRPREGGEGSTVWDRPGGRREMGAPGGIPYPLPPPARPGGGGPSPVPSAGWDSSHLPAISRSAEGSAESAEGSAESTKGSAESTKRGAESGREDEGVARLRPELELVFRTLLELRMDMDELRQEFEVYQEDVEDRIDAVEASRWALPGSGEVEVGTVGARQGPDTSATSPTSVPPPTDAPPSTDSPPSTDAEESSGLEGGTREGESRQVDSQEDPESTVVFEPGMTMDDLEAEAIRVVLRQTEGNRRKAAESLGIGERTLYRKIKRYGIEA